MIPDLPTCLHESAHAVASRVLNIEIVLCTAHPSDPHVRTRRRGNAASVLERLAVVDLAGTILENEPGRCGLDERHATERCMQIVAGDAEPQMRHWPAARRLKEQLRDQALQLVADHLAQIGAVAVALARQGKLSQSQIDTIMEGV
jgi:hypothetical protein